MSTFDILQSRIAQSAKAAAGAARKLSSLDELAQMDDYVNSEGLRLSGKKTKKGGYESSASSVGSDNSDLPSVRHELSGRFVDTASSSAQKQHHSPTRAPEKKNYLDGGNSCTTQAPTVKKNSTAPSVQLLKSVALLYNETNDVEAPKQVSENERSISSCNLSRPSKIQHFLQELEYESESDSSDDEQPKKPQNDLELTLPRNVAMYNQLESEPTSDLVEKDVHRFMTMTDQLESERGVLVHSQKSWSERSAATVDANRMTIKSGTTAGDDTNRALRAGLSWIRNIASPQIEALSKKILTKITESDVAIVSSDSNNTMKPMIGPRLAPHTRKNDYDQDEGIIVSTSAAFLGAEDAEELERIRMRSSSTWLIMIGQKCIDNPRYVFIAVTLVSALFVYFYSRNRSVDDVL